MSVDRVRRWGAGVGLAGGAAIAAALVAVGTAHAAPTDGVVDVAAASASSPGMEIAKIFDPGPGGASLYAALWDEAAKQAETSVNDPLGAASRI
ncbi:MAG: hypothetical protein ACRDTN_14000 [Mycobacterium sp.]